MVLMLFRFDNFKRDDTTPVPRAVGPRLVDTRDERLIIAKGDGAISLCGSQTSWGPDYASIEEGKFCRMDTKTLYPLCDQSTGISSSCFNIETRKFHPNVKSKRGAEATHIKYTEVLDWN